MTDPIVVVTDDPLWEQLAVSVTGTLGALAVAYMVFRLTRRHERERSAAEMSNARQLALEERNERIAAAEVQARRARVAGLTELLTKFRYQQLFWHAVTFAGGVAPTREEVSALGNELQLFASRLGLPSQLVSMLEQLRRSAREHGNWLRQVDHHRLIPGAHPLDAACRLLEAAVQLWEDTGIWPATPDWQSVLDRRPPLKDP